MNFDDILISVTFTTCDALRTLHGPASDLRMNVRGPTTSAEDGTSPPPYSFIRVSRPDLLYVEGHPKVPRCIDSLDWLTIRVSWPLLLSTSRSLDEEHRGALRVVHDDARVP